MSPAFEYLEYLSTRVNLKITPFRKAGKHGEIDEIAEEK
jgi:hypothetical protein